MIYLIIAKNISKYLKRILDFEIYYLAKDKKESFLSMAMQVEKVVQLYLNQSYEFYINWNEFQLLVQANYSQQYSYS